MLRELRIENLLLIERAELRLDAGLNVVTGETGAGKTILAHSLDLLLGGKARDGVVRPGAAEAWVEGTFDLPAELAADDDQELAAILERLPEGTSEVSLGRRVSAGGRTSAFIAGRGASAPELALLGGRLLAFYGQHQHRELTSAAAQLRILDSFGGREQLGLVAAYREAYQARTRAEAELAELRARAGEAERDLDLHRYELEEIEAVAPGVEEKEALAAERGRLRHVETIRGATGHAAALIAGGSVGDAAGGYSGGETGGEGAGGGLEGGATEAANRAAEALGRARELDPVLAGLADRAAGLALELDDLGGELSSHLSGLEADPARLAAVEERLTAIERLERKHGGGVEAVLAHAEHCREVIDSLGGSAEREQVLAAAADRAREALEQAATRLSQARREAAAGLERELAAELAELAMPGATLQVGLEPEPGGPGPRGAERVELALATNPGMAPAPLRDAASGGELSRVMLALTGLSDREGARTRVFDEIDAGIGGGTATVVGERLRRLAEQGQVIAITHLPQVASQAAVHLRVTKEAGTATGVDAPARAVVERLEGDAVVDEIRRMLGAEQGDEAATEHARGLVAAVDSR